MKQQLTNARQEKISVAAENGELQSDAQGSTATTLSTDLETSEGDATDTTGKTLTNGNRDSAIEDLRSKLSQAEERIHEMEANMSETQAELQRARQRERLNEDHSSRLTATVSTCSCVRIFIVNLSVEFLFRTHQSHLHSSLFSPFRSFFTN